MGKHLHRLAVGYYFFTVLLIVFFAIVLGFLLFLAFFTTFLKHPVLTVAAISPIAAYIFGYLAENRKEDDKEDS